MRGKHLLKLLCTRNVPAVASRLFARGPKRQSPLLKNISRYAMRLQAQSGLAIFELKFVFPIIDPGQKCMFKARFILEKLGLRADECQESHFSSLTLFPRAVFLALTISWVSASPEPAMPWPVLLCGVVQPAAESDTILLGAKLNLGLVEQRLQACFIDVVLVSEVNEKL